MAAREAENIEPAFGWAIVFSAGVFVMFGMSVFVSDGFEPRLDLSGALLGLAGAHLLLAVGVTGAMAEPLPGKSEAGRAALRLRVSWALLGLCPPPVRKVRLALAVLACILSLYPLAETGLFFALSAAAVLLSARAMGKPKSILRTEAAEAWFFAGTNLLSLRALFMVGGAQDASPWLGVALLAALLALQAQRAREVTALRWAELLPGVPPPPALDLARYELKVAQKPVEARLALPEGAEAQLVDSGGFRVDAVKMLDKLRQYQLTDPRDFLSAWLRCAEASGATTVSLTRAWDSIELRFDGRPFSTLELAQPYSVLVDGAGEDAVRGRHFAYGLLGLYRLRPRRVSVTSRGPDGVAALSVGRAAAAPDAAKAPEGTVIRVEWPAWAAWWRPSLLTARARQRCGLGRAALSVDGNRVSNSPPGPEWRTFKKSGWRGAFRGQPHGSRVRLYLLGALVEELDGEAKARVDAWLTHDELELDISQSSVVRGRRLDEGLRILADQAG